MRTTTRTGKNAAAGTAYHGRTSATDILDRVLESDKATFSPETAREILALDFSQEDKERMRLLSAKARDGELTAAEKTEIDNYERVGHLLGILQSKARRSLKGDGRANGKSKAN
jgi:hypothetical protein